MEKTAKRKFGAGPRIACTMWDFSWLTRRIGLRNEYADWDKVLDELVERGYNCIRLDVFPHLIARDEKGVKQEQFTILPEKFVIQWGNNIPVEVTPHESLIAFMKKGRARGICFGLSTWLNPDTQNRRSMLRTPHDYARVWQETLTFIEQHDLLDTVEWVDLTNEWPMGIWGGYYYPKIFNKKRPKTAAGLMLPMVLPWSAQVNENISMFMAKAIQPLKEKWPHLPFTFSFGGFLSGKYEKSDLSCLDILEPHLWLSDSLEFSLRSGALLAIIYSPLGVPILHRRGNSVFYRSKDKWQGILGDLMDRWVNIAKNYDMALYTSESWACTIFDENSSDGLGKEWKWIKDIQQSGVEMAVDKGWTCICSSNYCQPHFKGMWADIEWHKRVTNTILG